MSLQEQIYQLGKSFRGLWRSYRLLEGDDEIVQDKWTVTFIYKGEYIETPELDTPRQALDYALARVLTHPTKE